MKRVLRSIFTTFLLAQSFLAFATTYTFIGNGSWNNSANWAGGLIPPDNSISNIVITGNVTYTAGLALNAGSTLTIANGAVLTIQADGFSGSGGVWFDGAIITVDLGGVLNCWDWIHSVGTLNVNGLMRASSIFSNGSTVGSITVNGTFEVGGNGQFFGADKPIVVNCGGMLGIKPGCTFRTTSTITVSSCGTFVNRGTIGGNSILNISNFTNNGIISPGNSPGTITINGNYSPSTSAIHNFEIGGTSTTQFDRLLVTSNITLTGTLNVSLINGFTPSGSHDLVIFTGTISGTYYCKPAT